jgi:DNA-binding NarL/FixJ family response regulator
MNISSPVRVIVADDQTLFRSGLAKLLDGDPRVKVIAEASDGFEAVRKCAELSPDVILMDLKMPNLDGIKATEQILAANPEIRVLILTSFEADSHVLDALRAGAGGYVLKDALPESIVRAILALHAGEKVMASAVVQRVIGMLNGDATPRDYYDGLTPREIEIVKLIASGGGNKQIAFRLRISEKTVRNHISNVYEKLNIYDRSQAVLYAVRKGLVEI